ncbi:Fc.00g029340.m01.CDS01 [Cosmosporella sp. VM-42]
MPPSSETTPLPLAANRAALSNRISLLLSSQSSVLKSMNLSPSSASPTTRPRRALPEEEDDDILKGTRPNEGVGYVPDKKTAPVGNAREDRMLRGGLKGKGDRHGGKGKGRWKEESESDEEVGRSALGKRKRPRREVEAVPKPRPEAEREIRAEVNNEKAEGDAEVVKMDEDVKMEDTHVSATENAEEKDTPSPNLGEKKKRKKRKKKSNKVKESPGGASLT